MISLLGGVLVGPAQAELPPGLQKGHEGFSPEEARAAFTVPEGFTVDLLAAEPDIRQPIAFTFDEKGRIWLAEGMSYPRKRAEGEGGDRIVILEDADGDGSYETKKVFVDDLNLVSGLELGFGGLYVGAAPELIFIPILEGDQPGEREVLLDGWGYQDTHETLNSFTWGPDGWLYGCHGVFTHSKVGKPGTPERERERINAGVWRFHPTRREFEVFAHGTSNPWGLDYNERGDFFVEACVIPHFWHIMQNGVYHRQAGSHFNPYVFDDLKTIADHLHYPGGNQWQSLKNGASDAFGGGHAHCGLAIYLSDHFPADFYGDPLFFNLHGHRLNREKLVKNGSGWTARHTDDLFMANDSRFVGVSVKVGPDGALYFIDWQDETTCHHNDPLKWDRSNGRLYRLRYEGWQPLQPQWDLERALELTDSRNEWLARLSRRRLQELGPEKTAALREPLLAKVRGEGELRFRLRALWQLHGAGLLRRADLRDLLASEDENLRFWAIRLLAEEGGRVTAEEIGELVAMARQENSALVWRGLLSALSRLPQEGRWGLAEVIARQKFAEEDPNLARLAWFAVETLSSLDPRRAAELVANSPQERLVRFSARKLVSRQEWSEALLVLLQKSPPEQRRWLLTGLGEGLRGTKNPVLAPEVEKSLQAWRNEAALAAQVMEVLAYAGSEATLDLLAADFRKAPESGLGAQAFRILAASPRAKDTALFYQALGVKGLRLAALQGLQRMPSEDHAERIFAAYGAFSAEERLAANALLTSYAGSAMRLLEEIEKGRLPARFLTAPHALQIRARGEKDLSARLEKIWGKAGDPAAEMGRLTAKLTEEFLAAGDATRGAALYAETCGACHVLKERGGQIGPDLTGSNRANLAYLLTNILFPDAAVAEEYYRQTLKLKNGQVLVGMLVERRDEGVVLRYPGGERFVARKEMREMLGSTKSLMPHTVLTPLKDEEIRDLIYFLSR
ncbi:MAG: PVC-type heme-binding CxxCH protein [Verrucomicrobiales bacterium]